MPPTWVPDEKFESPDGHTWMRAVDDCPDCQCCTTQLCERARTVLLLCCNVASGSSDFDLSDCPCTQGQSEAIAACRAAVQAELDDDAAVEAGAQALHVQMTVRMTAPPTWEGSPYAASYRELVRRHLADLRKPVA